MAVEREDVYQAVWWLEHQRIFFIAAFGVGAVLILGMKVAEVAGWWITAVAIGIMLSYAFMAVKRKIKVRLDIIGDNLYYLGFLYTLISLSYSLYELGKEVADINSLLQNFGLAIMTTLTGLALRVFFNQPKADITEYENAVRMSLTEATANFVGEASAIGREVSTLRAVLNQIVQESIDAQKITTSKLNTAVEEQITLLDRVSNTNQVNIDALAAKIGETQKLLAASFKTNSEALARSISNSMARIEYGSEGFVTKFDEMSGALGTLANVLARLQVDIESWSKSVARVIEADETTAKNLSESVVALRRIQTDIITTSKSFTDSVEVTATSLKASANSVIGLVQKDITDATKLFSQSIQTSAQTLDSAVVSATRSMSENIRVIEERFARISDAPKEATAQISDTATKIDQLSPVEPQRMAGDARSGVR